MTRYLLGRLGWAVLVVFWGITIITFGVAFLSPVDPGPPVCRPARDPCPIRLPAASLASTIPIVFAVLFLSRAASSTATSGTSYSTGEPVRSSGPEPPPGDAGARRRRAARRGPDRASAGLPGRAQVAGRRPDRADGSLLGVVVPQFVLGSCSSTCSRTRSRCSRSGRPTRSGARPARARARFPRRRVVRAYGPLVGAQRPRGGLRAQLPREGVIGMDGGEPARAAQLGRAGGDHDRASTSGSSSAACWSSSRCSAGPGSAQAWNAISANDIPVVLGTVIVAATAVVIFNLVADIANALLDPRIRYSSERVRAAEPPPSPRPAPGRARGPWADAPCTAPRGPDRRRPRRLVRDQPGEAVGIVGESGCGKTAIALALLGLLPRNGRIAAGEILLGGGELVGAGRSARATSAGDGSRWSSRTR